MGFLKRMNRRANHVFSAIGKGIKHETSALEHGAVHIANQAGGELSKTFSSAGKDVSHAAAGAFRSGSKALNQGIQNAASSASQSINEKSKGFVGGPNSLEAPGAGAAFV